MRNKIRSVSLKARRDFTLRGFLLFILMLSLFGFSEAENMLTNGSFEEIDSEGHPIGWIEDAYNRDEGYTVFSITDGDAEDGHRAASIRNIGQNDARFAQRVEVEPESLYRFSGYIRAKDIEEGRGANLSIEGLYVFSESLYDTDGEWQYLEWYGETGEDQRSVTLFARIGGYSGESTGQAWFDNLRLEKVKFIPGNEVADLWYKEQQIAIFSDDEDTEESNASPAWPRLILIVLAYTLIATMTMMQIRKNEKAGRNGRFSKGMFLAGLGAAMAARMIISYFVTGYMVDVNCFSSWGSTMARVGPAMFYPESGFCDYPPAYTYILGLNAMIVQMIPEISDGMTRVVFRFFPCACDILACAALDRFLRMEKPDISEHARRSAIMLLAFHPVTILNSAAWCQMDSVLALLILMVAVWAIEGKWQILLPCYMLAVLVKPQALMLGFLGLGALIPTWRDQPESRKQISIGLGAALVLAFLIIVPFSLKQNPLWIFTQYSNTLASYPYATVNTANFYYLFEGNWDGIANPSHVISCVILALMSAGYGVAIWLRRRAATGAADEWDRSWIEAAISGLFAIVFAGFAILHVSWTVAGTGAMVFAFVIVMSLYLRKQDICFLPYMGGLLFLLLYVFGIKMHERYLFPAFFLMALAYGLMRDKRILTVMLGMTVTMFLNEGIVLDNSIRLGSVMGHLNEDTRTLAQIINILNCSIAIYCTWLGIGLSMPGAEIRRQPVRLLIRDNPVPDNRLHWNRKDTILLTSILAAYSLVTFSTLGSGKAPQHAWTSSDYDEQIVLDLGMEQENFTMLYFARVSRYDFSVGTSWDGINWEDETWAQMDQGQCWKWKYVTESTVTDSGTRTYGNARHWFSGRYVRITAHQINLALCEVLLRDENGNILPIISVEQRGGDESSPLYSRAGAVIDEQNTLEGLPVWFPTAARGAGDESDPTVPQPGWWNSTYFDEIYHARTAWEFLSAGAPYETSHPPLGKIIMSWGVALFGMTPFGWRFAGAAAGVIMLAGIWLVAKQMTKSTTCSAFACGLMALDCMHLTQTQIATIDSYPVLFILFAFFFMLRYLQSDWRTEKPARVLTDLGASGLFMGLAIASKWIGIYAGAGLAVLFFWHGGRILMIDRRERKSLGMQGRATELAARPDAWMIFLRICTFCVAAFILIPALIYLVSYVPYFAYRRFGNLREYLDAIVSAQTSMLNYHATPGLGMDHPFYSPWYEWPVMGKPMFYASKQYVFDDTLSYSIFCFGNPALWFPAIGTMILCAWMWIRNREEQIEIPAGTGSKIAGIDTNLVFLLVGFLAQYLPWMMVPRGTYIYHYFASVPFLVSSVTMVMEQIMMHRLKAGKRVMLGYIVLSAVTFLIFFPYVTGIFAPKAWLDFGRLFLKIWY